MHTHAYSMNILPIEITQQYIVPDCSKRAIIKYYMIRYSRQSIQSKNSLRRINILFVTFRSHLFPFFNRIELHNQYYLPFDVCLVRNNVLRTVEFRSSINRNSHSFQTETLSLSDFTRLIFLCFEYCSMLSSNYSWRLLIGIDCIVHRYGVSVISN